MEPMHTTSDVQEIEVALPTDLRSARRGRRDVLRHVFTWAGLFVSGAFAYFGVRHVQFSEVWTGLRTSSYWWLAPALVMLAVSVVIRAIRWRYLFRRETRPPFRPALTSVLIGYFFNSILPARAGEAVRIVALKRLAGTSVAESTGTVVVERTYDTLCLLVLLFVTLPWLPPVRWVHTAVLLAIGLAAGLAIAIVALALFGARPLRFALRALTRFPHLSPERVDLMADNLAHGFAALRRPALALGALTWTMLGWLTLAVSTWLLMLGFDLHVSFAGGLLVVIATSLAMILPSSPSAIGVFEAATLVALNPYGVADSKALSFALVLHALNFIPYIVVGGLLLRGSLRSLLVWPPGSADAQTPHPPTHPGLHES